MSIIDMLGGTAWPPKGVATSWAETRYFTQMRQNDEATMRAASAQAGMGGNDRTQPYIASPVPGIISRTSANLLFGEPVSIRPANPADEARLEEILAGNGLDAELHRAAGITSSDGELYGRIVRDLEVASHPIIEFVSSDRVVPIWRGRFLWGAYVVIDEWQERKTTYRVLQLHAPGYMETTLWQGDEKRLGAQIALEAHPRTATIAPFIDTGVDGPLIVHIPNRIDKDPRRGVSDYEPIIPLLLAINETLTIGQHNTRMTGKKRLIMPEGYARKGAFDLGDDVFLVKGSNAKTLGDDASLNIKSAEYSYEAAELKAWLDTLVDQAMLGAGLSQQALGRGQDGGPISGTALKRKLANTVADIEGKGRYWDAALLKLIRWAIQIDAAPLEGFGFGQAWTDPLGMPSIARRDGFPADPTEVAQEILTLASAEAISTYGRVRKANPDWTDEQVLEEVERIEADRGADAPSMGLFG